MVSADWPDGPAYQAASAPDAGSRYHQLLTPELRLPCRFEFTVRTRDLTGERSSGRSATASHEARGQPQNRLWAANRAAGSQATLGPRCIRIVR